MPTLPVAGKKYICERCSHQEVINYKDGPLRTELSQEEYELITSQQEINDKSNIYIYELDSMCEPCFSKMIGESEDFEFEIDQAEAEQENILALMKSRDLIDRDFWEKTGGDIISSIKESALGSFKKMDPEKFNQHLKLRDGGAGDRAGRFWDSLNKTNVLVDWMRNVGMDSNQACLQWIYGDTALKDAVSCCLRKVDGLPMPLKLDFQKGDAFGDEQAIYRYPAENQAKGYFVSLVEAKPYMEQQLELLEEGSYRVGMVEIFRQIWIDKLRVLLEVG